MNTKLLEEDPSLLFKLSKLKIVTDLEKDVHKKLMRDLVKLQREGKGEYLSLFTSTSEPEMVENIVTEVSKEEIHEVIQKNKWLQSIINLPIQCEWCIKVRQNCVKIVAQLLVVKINIE